MIKNLFGNPPAIVANFNGDPLALTLGLAVNSRLLRLVKGKY